VNFSMRFAEISRYLIAGFANTALSLGIFQLLVTFLNPGIAYALSWLSGLLFVGAAYPTFVFKVHRNWTNALALIIVYALVFVFGLLLIRTSEALLLNLRVGIFVVVIATTISNYIGCRLALRVCTKIQNEVLRKTRLELERTC
jgi:putative flippase GtrA